MTNSYSIQSNIWSYFADLQSHGRIASTQATQTSAQGISGMYDRPALSYGLFHAHAQPIKLLGQFATGVSFKGVMMDVGHLRHNRWVKDTSLPINQWNQTDPNANETTEALKRYAAYNRIRGQYSSALEHAIPERFFNDTTQCNPPGSDATTTPAYDPIKPACTEGISAVKAIAIAASQGQRVFTITQANAAQAIPQLSHRASVIEEVQSAVAAGKEVTIHESTITANGWSGAGYTVIDPQTGMGSYLIEGGARGAFMAAIATILVLFQYFYDSIASLAAHLHTPISLLDNISRFLQIARFVWDIF